LNAHILSQFKIGKEEDAAKKLVDFWLKVSDDEFNLVESWSWGMIYGFFYENSIYNAEKLYNFIGDYFKDKEIKRHLNVGLGNVLTGQYKSFKEHHSPDEFVKVLQASVAYPGVFKSIEAFDSVWFTGSSIYEIDLMAVVTHCEELGYKQEDMVIDAVLSGNPHVHHVYAKIFNAFAIG